MVYVIIVTAITSLFRSGLGENSVFADRYKIHSLTMVLLIYISLVDLFYSRINKKWVFMAGMIRIYVFSFLHGREAETEVFKKYTGMANESVVGSKLQPHGRPISKPS